MKKNRNGRTLPAMASWKQRKRARNLKAGQPPGYLAPSEKPESDRAKVFILEFSADSFAQREVSDAAALRQIDFSDGRVRWINVFGVRDVALLQALGELLGLHALALEDIATTDQRPRAEDYGDNLHIVMRDLKADDAGNIVADQISIVLNRRMLVTFQEVGAAAGPDVLEPLREKLRVGAGVLRASREDYLAYRIVDAVIDNYFVLVERVGDGIDRIQEQALGESDAAFLEEAHQMRRNMIFLKRSLWPVRGMVFGMRHSEDALFTESTQLFLRDAAEHVEQVVDSVEMLNESLTSALDIHLTGNGNRLNETMRVLTVMSAFFIPLTFIVGVYGMNFAHMPELSWRYGYLVVWVVMLGVTAGLLAYFRRRRWM